MEHQRGLATNYLHPVNTETTRKVKRMLLDVLLGERTHRRLLRHRAAQSVSTSVWTADGRLGATSAGCKADLAVHTSGRCSLGAAVPWDGEPSESHNLTTITQPIRNLTCSFCPAVWQLECLFIPRRLRRTVRTKLFVSSSGWEGWETLDALVSVRFRETS